MSKVILVRCPEASFRPEKYVTNQIIKALLDLEVPLLGIRPTPDFKTLESQSFFYSNENMAESFLRGIEEVISKIENEDVVFFADAFNPGIPLLRFVLHCKGIKAKICGIFHSSVCTPGDLLYSEASWSLHMEASIVHAMDTVYVATEYLKGKILDNTYLSHLSNRNIVVFGLPLIGPIETGCEIPYVGRNSPQVLFSHRWAPDKRPEDFIKLANQFRKKARFVVSHPVPLPQPIYLQEEAREAEILFYFCRTKQDYWNLLYSSHIIYSSAELETFGYSVLEAVGAGCIPIVPNRACYPELYRPNYIYSNSLGNRDTDLLKHFLAKLEDEKLHLPSYYFLPNKGYNINTPAELAIAKDLSLMLRM